MTPLTISLAPSGQLRLTWPDGHEVLIPATLPGLLALIKVLEAQPHSEQRIGWDAKPAQEQLETWIAAWKRAKPAEDIGLELEDLV